MSKRGGHLLAESSIRILVVDDYEPLRRVVVSCLAEQPELRIIAEASDGLEAVQKAKELQPDLILLDIGLPRLNGIEAARQISKLSPRSKILVVSQEASDDLVQAALGVGAMGYVVKRDMGRDLLLAVNAILRDEIFVTSRFTGHDFSGTPVMSVSKGVQHARISDAALQGREVHYRHEVAFCSDEASFLDGFTRFIGAALRAGSSVIVVATESHRDRLLPRLQAHGLDIGAAIEQGRYVALDVVDTLSTFMVNGLADPVRFSEVARNLVRSAAKAAQGVQARVAMCGECAPLLWAQGNADAAIQLEQLWDKLARKYNLDILCEYSLASIQREIGGRVFRQICAEHSAVHSR